MSTIAAIRVACLWTRFLKSDISNGEKKNSAQVLDIVSKILYGCPERRIWCGFQIPVDKIAKKIAHRIIYEKVIENAVVAYNYGALKLS